ncbi:hypothetical protein E2C01_053440 [Portunus trituberculatus]|uniref:Uncharacterized protein n=1 Tax=Portunus trituberculatus TaxID=210409 RepID=A0A5B7GH43_PORTR|nr:hypothetical protein [Portunus trituberculatus]
MQHCSDPGNALNLISSLAPPLPLPPLPLPLRPSTLSTDDLLFSQLIKRKKTRNCKRMSRSTSL